MSVYKVKVEDVVKLIKEVGDGPDENGPYRCYGREGDLLEVLEVTFLRSWFRVRHVGELGFSFWIQPDEVSYKDRKVK